MLSSEKLFESENTNSGAAVPGAESNDGTVMVHPDYGSSSSSQSESERNFLPNENIKYTITPAGSIEYAKSSISISMIRYRELHEEDAKEQDF